MGLLDASSLDSQGRNRDEEASSDSILDSDIGKERMNHQQLDRCLRSIGKECFIKYYDQFSDLGIRQEDLVDLLMKKEGYEESGCRTRISCSRRIFREGQAEEALREVIQSERLDGEIIRKASNILARMQ